MRDKRFWIDDNPPKQAFVKYSWVGVVDEKRGGIIAYFGRMEDAEVYITYLESEAEFEAEARIS